MKVIMNHSEMCFIITLLFFEIYIFPLFRSCIVILHMQGHMAELRQAQLRYAMRYQEKYGSLPPKADLPATVADCCKSLSSANAPIEDALPDDTPFALRSPPERRTPPALQSTSEQPSRRRRDKRRKRARDIADEIANAENVDPHEVHFLWDHDSEQDIPDLQSSDSDDGDTGFQGKEMEERDPHFEMHKRVKISRHNAVTPGKVVLSFLRDGSQAEVFPHQVPKAVRILDPDIMRDVMCAANCRCSRRCFTQFPLEVVRHVRAEMLHNSTNEHSLTEYLADVLRKDNPNATQPNVNLQYKLTDIRGSTTAVCSMWWQAIRGISNNKMIPVRELLRSGRRFCAPSIRTARGTASDSINPDRMTKYQTAFCFWHDFFEKFCNRPNADERLFPTNDTLRQMYATWYHPWYAKMKPHDFPNCEYETFRDARYDPAFKDVLKRPKHNHCKCPNCLDLELWRKRAFRTQFEVDAYTAAYAAHRESIAHWRKFEKNLKSSAITNPAEVTVLEYDATLAHGFPHFGQRPPKGLDVSRLWVVPTHISRLGAQHTYVYHLKEVLKKDANLCITLVYHQIRCAKEVGPSAHAKKLVLVADNAKDNKCDPMLAFAVELVLQNWYNEVELDFGEVGHNHNGQDSAHHKLNAHVGKKPAMTLGEEQFNYGTVWASGKAPAAVIQPFAYDWTRRYDIKAYRRITGYFRTKVEKESANAFCARKGQNGDVEVVWKVRAQDPTWLGADGQPAANQYDNSGSPGFIVLTAPPLEDMRLAGTSENAVNPSYVQKVHDHADAVQTYLYIIKLDNCRHYWKQELTHEHIILYSCIGSIAEHERLDQKALF